MTSNAAMSDAAALGRGSVASWLDLGLHGRGGGQEWA